MTAAAEFVEMMESLDFEDFKVSIKSTNVPNTIAANRLLSERIPYPIHLGITEAGTKWSGSLKSAVGLGTLLADGVGDTIRISLSTFHAEEEVKVAWEILKALQLRERGPVLIACPTCGRLQFDMDSVVAEIEARLEAYAEPIEVAVLGCAVNGIGEASHADFGITGAKNEGLIFAHGKPLRKVPQEELVDALFAEIDKSLDRGSVEVDDSKAAEGAEWLQRIEEENADELTPERIAKLEAEKARAEGNDVTAEPFLKPVKAVQARTRPPRTRSRASGRDGPRTRRRPPGAGSPAPEALRPVDHLDLVVTDLERSLELSTPTGSSSRSCTARPLRGCAACEPPSAPRRPPRAAARRPRRLPARDRHELAADPQPRRDDPEGPRRPAAAGLAGRLGRPRARPPAARLLPVEPVLAARGHARLLRRADRLRAGGPDRRRARRRGVRYDLLFLFAYALASSAPTCSRASSASGPAAPRSPASRSRSRPSGSSRTATCR